MKKEIVKQNMGGGLCLGEVFADEWRLNGWGGEWWPIVRSSGCWLPFVCPVSQRRDGFETMACTTYATQSALSCLLSCKLAVGQTNWATESHHNGRGLQDGDGAPSENPHLPEVQGVGLAPQLNYERACSHLYSARFTATLAGTTKRGNSPHKVAETIRKYGLLDEAKLPFVANWEGFYDMSEAREKKPFAKQYDVQHQWLFERALQPNEQRRLLGDAIRVSPIGVAVFAWASDGETYVLPDGVKANHWSVLVDITPEGRYVVLDTYEPYIKILSSEYVFPRAKMYRIGPKKAKWWQIWR